MTDQLALDALLPEHRPELIAGYLSDESVQAALVEARAKGFWPKCTDAVAVATVLDYLDQRKPPSSEWIVWGLTFDDPMNDGEADSHD